MRYTSPVVAWFLASCAGQTHVSEKVAVPPVEAPLVASAPVAPEAEAIDAGPLPVPLLVALHVCTNCTFFSVARAELFNDGTMTTCTNQNHWSTATATPDELATIRKILESEAWRSLESNPGKIRVGRYDSYLTHDKDVTRVGWVKPQPWQIPREAVFMALDTAVRNIGRRLVPVEAQGRWCKLE